jgi:hypothetical protein
MNRTRRVGTGIVGAALLLASVLGAAPGSAGAVDRSQNDVEPFVDVLVELADHARATSPVGSPEVARVVRFDRSAMLTLLADAPTGPLDDGLITLSLPAPNFTMMSFAVWESAVMSIGLAQAFPEIRTYAGQGTNDPATTVVFDVTPHGFHAQVLSPTDAWFINPAAMGDDVVHESFFRSDRGVPQNRFIEPVPAELDQLKQLGQLEQLEQQGLGAQVAGRSGTQIRTLRTAVAATSQYTAQNGGTRALALAAIVTAVNRVSGIYVTEISTRLQIVAGNENLVYVSRADDCPEAPSSREDCDPFTNTNDAAFLSQNQLVVDGVIGDANYDLGHVFTVRSGLASLGVAGTTGSKAEGTTGTGTADDGFFVDYVAHEMGHQLGGSHTFNGVNGACAGNAEDDATLRVEPGSGSTIQGHAGICDLDNLQNANDGQPGDGSNDSDPYFHSLSFDQITAFLATVDFSSLGSVAPTATGNIVPTADAGLDVTIPAQTPFFLTATSVDPDANGGLTYNFEQRDGGIVRALNDPEISDGPLFRSFEPTASPTSFFPRLSEVAAGNTNQNGPCADLDGSMQAALCWSQYLVPTGNSRSMNFRATVRDNWAGGGGVNTDDMVVTVHDTGTPFALSEPNGGESLSGTTTVTWTVGGTVDDPVSAGTVSIRMSTDGGLTFPTELLADTPNDGSAELSLTKSSSAVRLMVHSGDFTNGAGFFDISDANFTAGKAMAAGFAPVNPARLLETRVGHGLKTIDGLLEGDGRLADGETIEFQVTGRGGIPASADSASLNIVAISADGPGFLTVYPCDQARPVPAASVNYDGGDVRSNAVLTKLSLTGTACIYTLRATDLAVDVNGAFSLSAGFDSVNPARLLETRNGPGLQTADGQLEGDGRLADGETIEFQVTGRAGVPEGARAASLNVVAISADGPGFLTVYPCDQARPVPAASVNYDGGDVRPNAVLTKLSATGTVCVYTLRATDLVVDVNGAFAAGSSFSSINPARLLETRPGPNLKTIDGKSQGGGRIGGGQFVTLQVTGRAGVPEGARAASLNVVAIFADGPGFLTVYPCDQARPVPAASVNYDGGDVRPNAVLTKLSATGTVCLYTLRATDIVVDVNGAIT